MCTSITKHKILDANPTLDTKGIFLDLSRKQVWHEGLIYKLHLCGVQSKLLDLLTDYLDNRRQRVIINTATSWKPTKTGVSDGSVLGPLYF